MQVIDFRTNGALVKNREQCAALDGELKRLGASLEQAHQAKQKAEAQLAEMEVAVLIGKAKQKELDSIREQAEAAAAKLSELLCKRETVTAAIQKLRDLEAPIVAELRGASEKAARKAFANALQPIASALDKFVEAVAGLVEVEQAYGSIVPDAIASAGSMPVREEYREIEVMDQYPERMAEIELIRTARRIVEAWRKYGRIPRAA
jgi:chromosome segregation ATPase